MNNNTPVIPDILIVDDNPENLKVLGDFFGDLGFNVRVARNGQQALENAVASPPEIILLDIHMPIMDGYDACTLMKTHASLIDVPIIFLSALGETFNKVRAFECGGADYITKPFNLQEVRVRVNNQLLTKRLLAESKAGFKASFEQLAVGMAHLSLDGFISVVNQKCCTMLGWERIDLQGKNFATFVDDAAQNDLKRALDSLNGNRVSLDAFEVPCIHADGSKVWCRCTFSLVSHQTDNPYIAAILEDVSQEKAAAEERRRLMAALEQVAEAIAVTGPDGVIQYVNAAYTQVFRTTEEEVVGTTLPILSGEETSTLPTRDIWKTLSAGEIWTGTVTKEAESGKSSTEEYILSPVRNETGAITNYVAVARDLTRQIRLEEQLRQSQKMEAIGTLAAGIAHDFNNLLSAIMGFTQLVMEDLPTDHESRSDLQEVLSAGSHATELVRQILAFSRQSAYEIRPVKLEQIADEALKLLRRSIPPTIHFSCKLDPECRPVLADATAIHQIIMNLCTNAYHAMEDTGGTLTIRLSEITLGEENFLGNLQLEPGVYARLDIADTGHGMDKETLQRIFEPYFTTKERGAGTGLGLATVHGIVSDLHGALYVYSEPENGSTFSVFLPISPEAAATDSDPVLDEASCSGTERILFVDDERAICSLATKALGRLGYRALAVTDPLEALTIFEENPDDFDIVVTDEMMPDMRGTDLLPKLRAVREDIPVILYSGFAETLRNKPKEHYAFNAFVMKPLVVLELAKAIRAIATSAAS